MNCENNKKINKRLLTLLLTSLIVALTVTTALGFDFGYSLYIKDKKVGTFATEKEALDAVSYISRESKSVLEKSADIKFFISEGENFTTNEEAFENFKKNNPRYEKAYTVSVGNEEIFSLGRIEDIEEIKNEILSLYHEEFAVSVDFSGELKVEEKYILKEEFSEKEEAKEILSSFPVETVVKKSLYEVVPYGVIYVDDEEVYVGETLVLTKGRSGEKYVEYTTTKINGNEVETKITGEFVINTMENEIIRVGKKPLPKGMATGNFLNPTEGRLTSPFGSRWGRRHNGIDIGAKSGTPIYAADGGEVIYAGWMSGYGYLVQINHKNGYVTYYAHCSKLHVKVGDLVSQGDLISDMGSTGNSTGPHLHFEVRLNNVPKNPQNYVKY